MALHGQAAVAMWWNIAPEVREEFEDWHSHEHFPERLGLPGFQRGSRWRSLTRDGDFFVLYELRDYATLTSREYLVRLNDPTPWSTKMMPHHHDMIRSQCVLQASQGCGLGSALLVVRCAPDAGAAGAGGGAAETHESVARFIATLPARAGVTSAHLLVTRTPEQANPTREQAIRGGDAVADWIILIAGYDAQNLSALCDSELNPQTDPPPQWRRGLEIQEAAVYGLRDHLSKLDLDTNP